MDNNLPGGNTSSLSLFAKIKQRLSGIPAVILALLAFFGAAVLILGAYIFLSPDISFKDLFKKIFKQEEQVLPENIWTPYLTTPPPIGHGTQVYNVSGGVEGLPRITMVTLIPEDPEMNSSQTITVKASYTSPIQGVEVVLHTDDYKDTTYPLQLSSGTPTDGEWKGTWKVENPYNYIYRVTVKVKNEQNLVQMVTLTLR
jgi:hypothetical protein